MKRLLSRVIFANELPLATLEFLPKRKVVLAFRKFVLDPLTVDLFHSAGANSPLNPLTLTETVAASEGAAKNKGTAKIAAFNPTLNHGLVLGRLLEIGKRLKVVGLGIGRKEE